MIDIQNPNENGVCTKMKVGVTHQAVRDLGVRIRLAKPKSATLLQESSSR